MTSTHSERAKGFAVKNWYQDIQTGAGKDALLLRPGLAAALKEARAARCPLVVYATRITAANAFSAVNRDW